MFTFSPAPMLYTDRYYRSVSLTDLTDVLLHEETFTDVTGLKSGKFVSSVNSAYEPSLTKMVQWVPKNPKLLKLRTPREPIFNPPKHKKLRKFVPLPGVSEKISRRNKARYYKWKMYYRDWYLKETLMKRRLARYKLSFERRMKKYQDYKRFYERIQLRLKHGMMRVKQRKLALHHFRQENPYDLDYIEFDTDTSLYSRTVGWGGGTPVGDDFYTKFVGSNNDMYSSVVISSDVVDVEFADDLAATLDQLKYKVQRKLQQKLTGQDVHVANIVGERAQTISMLIHAVASLSGMITGDFSKVLKTMVGSRKNFSNTFLEYQFGWAPLVSDIDSALKQLAVLNNSSLPADEIVVRSNSTKVIDQNTSTGNTYGPFAPTYVDQIQLNNLIVKGTVTYSSVHKWHLDNPTLATLNHYGLVNPLEVMWELTPWSFVIDWFLPICSLIQSFSANAGYTWVAGTETTSTDLSFHVKAESLPISSGPLDVSKETWRMNYRRRTKSRRVLISPPGVLLPKFKSPYSLVHGMDSIALFVQRLKR